MPATVGVKAKLSWYTPVATSKVVVERLENWFTTLLPWMAKFSDASPAAICSTSAKLLLRCDRTPPLPPALKLNSLKLKLLKLNLLKLNLPKLKLLKLNLLKLNLLKLT